MIIEKILGNLHDIDVKGRKLDTIDIEWYEVNKKILKKDSSLGKEIGIRLSEHRKINDGDILYMDDSEIIAVNIPESEVILIEPKSMVDMGTMCYEIGNQHVPLFLTEGSIMIPYEKPLMELLDKKGFNPKKEMRKLVNGVECHKHSHHHQHEHE
ncbi:urease accessory protein UreE [Clostridium hydrogenum]|uniref:urease accessory protein UreE n=1 Tax=Clostridium hydrogenum TaxID=2855764 RepID=UPI001F3798E6|nr:urease accessory protein UreE [Clostridium hydrogenum]